MTMSPLWLSVALLACNADYNFSSPDERLSAIPILVADPEDVDFGRAPMGSVNPALVDVSNVGTGLLHVHDVRVEGSAAFSLPEPVSPFSVDLGQSEPILLQFTPAEPEALAWLVLDTDDPAREQVRIPLIGEAALPMLVIEPVPLDFGLVRTGTTVGSSFELHNVGDAPLIVNGIELPAATPFEVLDPGQLLIPPGRSIPIAAAYSPQTDNDVAVVSIHSNAFGQPLSSLPMTGERGRVDLEVYPTPEYVGQFAACSSFHGQLELHSTGNMDVVVYGSTAVDVAALPITIPPGDLSTVAYTGLTSHQGFFEVSGTMLSNDDDGPEPFTIEIDVVDPLVTPDFIALTDPIELVLPAGDQATVTLTVEFEPSEEPASADIAFVIDTSGSMGSTAIAVADQFGDISAELDLLHPDLSYGVASYEDYGYSLYGDPGYGDRPFRLMTPQTTDISIVQAALDSLFVRYGGDEPESTFEALQQALTGHGWDQNCDGAYDATRDVRPSIAHPADAFGGGVAGSPMTFDAGTGGGMGFREGALPIIVYATDSPIRDPSSGYGAPPGCPGAATLGSVATEIAGLEAMVIGVAVEDGYGGSPNAQMADLATATGMDPASVLTWSGSSAQLRDLLVDAIGAVVPTSRRLTLEDDDAIGWISNVSPSRSIIADTEVSSLTFDVTLEGIVDARPCEQLFALQLWVEDHAGEVQVRQDVIIRVPGTP